MPGFEPATFYMQSERSNTEVNRRYDKYSINLQHPVYLKCLPVRFQILFTIQVIYTDEYSCMHTAIV